MIKYIDWWYVGNIIKTYIFNHISLGIAIGILLGWLIFGCSLIPVAQPANPPPSASQSLIDREVERVNLMNEAFRKLTGMGCNRETIIETDAYIDSHNVDSYYEYECETNGGLWLKLRKFKDRWVIHGE